jgi:hypothetical protein
VPPHVKENIVAAVRGPLLWLPLLASVPLQPPEAVQELAFVALQVRVVASPRLTTLLATLSETCAIAGCAVEEPPPPPHATNIMVAAAPTNGVENRILPLNIFSYPTATKSTPLMKRREFAYVQSVRCVR